ncbi:UNVERIFIED_CONTAM: hypothetical protein FKN15_040618 [Acipenser sinensis]
MPDEELTSSPEAMPPCPEEEGTSTELPQSDYETGSKTGGGTEAEAVAVESGEAAEKDGADGEEDEGMYETDDGGLSDSSLISDVPDSQPVRKKLYTLQYICNFLDSTKGADKKVETGLGATGSGAYRAGPAAPELEGGAARRLSSPWSLLRSPWVSGRRCTGSQLQTSARCCNLQCPGCRSGRPWQTVGSPRRRCVVPTWLGRDVDRSTLEFARGRGRKWTFVDSRVGGCALGEEVAVEWPCVL